MNEIWEILRDYRELNEPFAERAKFYLGFWMLFPAMVLAVSLQGLSRLLRPCHHDWIGGRHPVTLELKDRICSKCLKRQKWRSRWK